jgi:tetratricopeptide (TPR) repeat protein
MLKNSLLIIYLAVGASLAVGGLLAPATAVAQQAKVSTKVGEPLKAALDAANKGQYPQALAKLKEAEAAPGKTGFDQYKINETYGFVYLKQRNYAQAAAAYERSLNSGQLPAAQANDRLKQLAELNFQAPRDLTKVIDYANRYLKATGGTNAPMQAMLGQAYQLQGNHKAAIASVQNAVRLSGGRPSENWLRILLKSYGALGDARGVSVTTEQLVTLYPTQDNWRLLSSELRKQASGDDRTALNVYRLMGQVDVMDKPDLYSEAAIVAIQSGLPAEAVQFMEKGLERKVFSATETSRAERILADARKKRAAQQPGLDALTKQAAASKLGQDEVLLGEVLLSYGQADKALAAGKRALQKGASPDQAWMLVGRSQVQLKNGVEARKAFSQVKGPDAAPIAKLWGIAASRI